jgi:hypothetical protein
MRGRVECHVQLAGHLARRLDGGQGFRLFELVGIAVKEDFERAFECLFDGVDLVIQTLQG